MVVKIMDSSPSMRSAMDYNENKVSNGDAIVLHSANADKDLDVRETLKRYERRNRRSIELSFHMSVNPSNTDGMTKEQVKEFVQEVMTGLGLGSQPYIIYQHNDIEREHYHVVSIRTNRNGKKITSRQENRRCLSLINELAIKYGYRVGKEPVQKQSSAQTQCRERKYRFADREHHQALLYIPVHILRAVQVPYEDLWGVRKGNTRKTDTSGIPRYERLRKGLHKRNRSR